MDPGNLDLVAFIRETIRRDGPVSFDWFMEQALYHPAFGYYSTGQCQIGRRGDYFTNVSVGPLFGRMLATQFAEMWEMMGRPDDFTIVEQGAHHGEFANDVLTAMREYPATLHYCIIEPFPILQARQEETLTEFRGKTTWVKSLANLKPFSGVHFSNELIDSMPVRLIVREPEGEWQEKFVAEDDSNFAFTRKPIADPQLRAALEKIPPIENVAYETEVNLAASDWVQSVAQKLQRGFVLGVDYGYPRTEFYATERTTGTLQSFARHRTVSSPLKDVGRVDITAHVDWTTLAEGADNSGLKLVGFTDQHHFMTGLLARHTPIESERRALQTLLHPEFLGTRFQYLGLSKNIESAQLTGFRFARGARQALF
ncbi:MAG TPA: SAM-dependent methyltransferase [Chthoniobacterales bacterium]|jgi:SAM-dependent MidA family methyltransferase|nr:SAM-dependent methyltransferase [Chthoniobacterales bacterium]